MVELDEKTKSAWSTRCALVALMKYNSNCALTQQAVLKIAVFEGAR